APVWFIGLCEALSVGYGRWGGAFSTAPPGGSSTRGASLPPADGGAARPGARGRARARGSGWVQGSLATILKRGCAPNAVPCVYVVGQSAFFRSCGDAYLYLGDGGRRGADELAGTRGPPHGRELRFRLRLSLSRSLSLRFLPALLRV